MFKIDKQTIYKEFTVSKGEAWGKKLYFYSKNNFIDSIRALRSVRIVSL